MALRRGPRATALLAAAVVAVAGCAAPVRRGEGGVAAPAPAAAGAVRPAPSAAAAPRDAGSLDPSEEITPEELASIPDPTVPAPRAGASAPEAPSGVNGGLKASPGRPMDSVPPGRPEAPSAPPERGPSPPDSSSAWRVQIFASDLRAEAERVGREAGARLGVPADVVREGALFKVRLGRFATEAEAQALRDRAREAGYGGAFRLRAR